METKPSTKEITALNALAWSLSTVVLATAFIGWGQARHWQFGHLSSYTLFPLFGLVAFSLMWTHYIIAAARQYLKLDRQSTHLYFEVTSFIVLLAILMHPGLLEWQLLRDGFGFPPGSVLNNFVAPGMRWAALIGMISWLIFLAYEFRRIFGNRPWWPYLQYASDLAMIAILIHSLRLGSQLQVGWLRSVWYFYGTTLLASLSYIYYGKFFAKKPPADV